MATQKFVKGSDIDVFCQFVDANTKEPLDMTDFSGATGYFPGADADVPNPVVGSLDSEDRARVKLQVPSATTLELPSGPFTFEVVMIRGSKQTRASFEDVLEAIDSLVE